MTGGFLHLVLLAYFVAIPLRSPAQSAQDPMLAHYDSAHIALVSGDQDRASIEYKAFIAEAIHRVANARARTGDWSEAKRNFDEALSFADQDCQLRLDYASVLFDQDELAEGQSMAQSVLERSPNDTRAHILLGRINFQQNRYAQSAAHFQAAADGGQFPDAWRLLALAYLRLQQPERAKPVLQEALRLLGESARNRVLIATVYYYGDYPELAIDELRKALAQNVHAPDAHYYLGLAYLGNNEAAGYESAIPEFAAQLREDPADSRSHYMLGYIALQRHNMKLAEEELGEARRLNSRDEGVKLLLSEVYSDTGRAKQATDMLRSLTSGSHEERPADFTAIRAHYMLGRLLQREGRIEEGARETGIAEQLRRQLRASGADIYQSRTSKSLTEHSGAATAAPPTREVSPGERERANDFVKHLEPLIGEAYFNLARIAALHHDDESASRYSARAVAWDPFVATLQGR